MSLQDFEKVLGNRLRMRREELGISQIALATLAQVTQDRISRYESGTREIPRPVFERIAKALGMTVEALCQGIQNHVTMTETERDAFCLRMVRKATHDTIGQAFLMLALGCVAGAKPADQQTALRTVMKRGIEYGIADDKMGPILEFIQSGL